MYAIRQWTPDDRDAVIVLIVGIQQGEFGLQIDAAAQPDLTDVDGSYRDSGGAFWVAVHDGEVVGTIAAIGLDDGSLALRKMFVAADHRGSSGLAAQLMQTLLDWGRAAGRRRVYLGTTSVMNTAHRFYEKCGFTRIDPSALPTSFPRMSVDSVFFVQQLDAHDHDG